MNFSIITEYPIWLTFFCLMLAGGLSFWLYRKDEKFVETPRWLIHVMSTFRFISIFVLSFLLLSPLIKTISRSVERPIIIFAQDNSESIIINKDSSFYKNDYSRKISEFTKILSENYETSFYSFGNEINKTNEFTFNEKESDFSKLFSELNNRYANRNVGALILAGDGIYNKGINPLYSSGKINFPIYTIALGDTNIQKDVILTNVRANKIAFLGNDFPVLAQIRINRFKGAKTRLVVSNKNEVVFSKDIQIDSEYYAEDVDITLQAKNTGMQHYKIRLEALPDEVSLKNNDKDIVIDIIDSRQKILLLMNSPHPDGGAIRDVLKKNRNFDVDLFTLDKFKGKVTDYNLLILHQLPSLTNQATKLLGDLNTEKIPVLFILGSQSSIPSINNLKSGINIIHKNGAYDETQAIFNEKFSYFELNKDITDFIHNVPPLIVPYGQYKIGAMAEVLFYQKINRIETQKPLFVMSENPLNKNKTAFLLGEGLWRWKMADFRQHSNHDKFDELINKIVQFLTLRQRKDNFILNMKNIYAENEAIKIEAEVYNESFQLLDNAEVKFEVTNEKGNKYDLSLLPDGTKSKIYTLNAGVFPIGDYTFAATAKIGDKIYSQTGSFTVLPVNLEATNTIANHKLLYKIAQKHQGKMFYPNQIDSIIFSLKNNSDIAPISYTEKNLRDMVHLKWIFVFILLFLSAEWFLRKYYGSY